MASGRYLHLYPTKSAHDADHTHASVNYRKPWLGYVTDDKTVSYNLPPLNYLAFEALEDGTFSFTMDSRLSTDCVESVSYSLNNGKTWVTTENADGEEIVVTTPTVAQGGKVLWKGEAVQYCSNADSYEGSRVGHGYFTSSGDFNASGNMMSMIYGDAFEQHDGFPERVSTGYSAGAFSYIFGCRNCNIVSAEDLLLTVDELDEFCYRGMFNECTSLAEAPVLPATDLADYCYECMFKGCTSLEYAPDLMAREVPVNGYRQMFQGCTSIDSAPKMAVETLSNYCFAYMFKGCTSLRESPELPVTDLAEFCYTFMFSGCTSLVLAPSLPATTMQSGCYEGMFQGCTSLSSAPALHSTSLASSCYGSMFAGCTSLASAPALPATTLATGCYFGMLQNCTTLTSSPELPATELVSDCYSYMFNGCTNLNRITAAFTTTPSNSVTSYWVAEVAGEGKFFKSSDATWNVTGVHGIPEGWIVSTIGGDGGDNQK